MSQVKFKVWSNALLLREFTVDDIVRATGLNPSSVQSVLQRMRKDHLVDSERVGQHAVYRLTDDPDALDRLSEGVEAFLPPLPPADLPSSSYYLSAQRRLDEASFAEGQRRARLLVEAERDLESAEQAEGGGLASELVRAYLGFERARLAYLTGDYERAKPLLQELRNAFAHANNDRMVGRIDELWQCLEFQEQRRAGRAGRDAIDVFENFIRVLSNQGHRTPTPVVPLLMDLCRMALALAASRSKAALPTVDIAASKAAGKKLPDVIAAPLIPQQVGGGSFFPALAGLLVAGLARQSEQPTRLLHLPVPGPAVPEYTIPDSEIIVSISGVDDDFAHAAALRDLAHRLMESTKKTMYYRVMHGHEPPTSYDARDLATVLVNEEELERFFGTHEMDQVLHAVLAPIE
jgi:hypothetical protein